MKDAHKMGVGKMLEERTVTVSGFSHLSFVDLSTLMNGKWEVGLPLLTLRLWANVLVSPFSKLKALWIEC